LSTPKEPSFPAALRPGAEQDESLIADARAHLTPAQMVERKLISLLKGKLVPVSHVRMTDLPGHWDR
jgi:hypothetical protein